MANSADPHDYRPEETVIAIDYRNKAAVAESSARPWVPNVTCRKKPPQWVGGSGLLQFQSLFLLAWRMSSRSLVRWVKLHSSIASTIAAQSHCEDLPALKAVAVPQRRPFCGI